MRILALTRYERLGSSSRVRFYQYFPYLESQGVEIVNAPFFKDDYVLNLYKGKRTPLGSVFLAYLKRLSILLTQGSYDLQWVEKELFPWVPSIFENFFQSRHIPYVVDYDDAVFHRYDMHTSGLVRALLKRKIDNVMRHATLVIAGNDYLAERAKQAGAKKIEYLPSVVDVSNYKMKKDNLKSPFEIGWIGSPVTAPYLNVVKDALTLLANEANIHVTLIGSGDVAPFPDIPSTLLPWGEEAEQSISEIFDVGIMPLVDGPFERGKCGYKLVQYMAGGLPIVASPVGINRQMIEPGINGYLASSTEEWLETLRTLINDHQLVMEMGRAGRQKAEQKYNLQSTAPKLLDLLSSAQKVENKSKK